MTNYKDGVYGGQPPLDLDERILWYIGFHMHNTDNFMMKAEGIRKWHVECSYEGVVLIQKGSMLNALEKLYRNVKARQE